MEHHPSLSTASQVLDYLVCSDPVRGVSGSELASRLTISRVAIWKAVEQLREQGYRIESRKGSGYRLVPREDGLLPGEVYAGLKTQIVGRPTLWRPVVQSTNSWAASLAAGGAKTGTTVIAGRQQAGRGRLGRHWHSAEGGLYLTVIMRPQIPLISLPAWSLSVSLAVAETLSNAVPQASFHVKWPNDVLAGGKKVAGILCEAAGHADQTSWVAVGIGLNVNNSTESLTPSDAILPISLKEVTGQPMSLRPLLQSLLFHLEHWVPAHWGPIEQKRTIENWRSRASGLGSKVTMSRVEGGQSMVVADGIFLGLDDQGAAMIRNEDGTLVRFLTGDLSLRSGHDHHDPINAKT